MRRRLDLSTRDITLLAVLTALPLLGYQFGVGNQVEQFAIIERLRDPNFIAGDFYTDSAATFGPRYYYSLLLSLLASIVPLPVVVLLLTCAANLALILVTFAATRTRLGATAGGAAIAAALAVANSSFPLGLAAYLRYESFQPASLAVPLGLLGFVWLTDGKRFAAVGAFFAAALFHPLIGPQTAMIAFAACALADLASRRPFRSLLGYIPSGALFAALLFVAWVLPGMMSAQGGAMSSEEFFSIIPAFRSPHHYLGTTFPLSHYVQLAAFLAAMAVLVVQARRVAEHSVLRTRLIFATAVVLALCVVSFILVDGLHSRIAASAQIFRALLVVKWAGFVLFGAVAGRWLSTGRPLLMVAPFAVLVATGAAQPLVMLGVTLAVLLAERMPIGRRAEIALAALLLVAVAGVTIQIGAREEAVRAALAGLSIGLFYLAPIALVPASAVAVSLTLALILFGWINRERNWVDRDIFQPTYQWADVKGDDADIARWVKANTPPGAVWITPPSFEAFRLLAERPIVVDWTCIPLQEDAMREWRRRIRAVYGDVPGSGFVALQGLESNYRSITPDRLAQLSAEFNAPFAVIARETPWPGAVLYENGEYKAVQPAIAQSAARAAFAK
jgi:hypothetical protein